MSEQRHLRLLRGVLVLIGAVMLLGVYPLMMIWPSGWRWQPYNPAYEHMIVIVYAVLGGFLLNAARAPARHRSLILFAAWSSVAHGAIMFVHAVANPAEKAHLWADVPALLIAGALLLAFRPRVGADAC